MLRICFSHSVIVRSPGLLPMLYTVRELAEAIGVPDRTLRDWLVAGAPYVRDDRDNLWINGKEFADWVVSLRKKRHHKKLQPGEAYCVRCNQVVAMTEVTTHARQGKLVMLYGKCPNCGRRIWRGARSPSPSANNITCQEIPHEN